MNATMVKVLEATLAELTAKGNERGWTRARLAQLRAVRIELAEARNEMSKGV